VTPFLRFLAGPALAAAVSSRLGACDRHEADRASEATAPLSANPRPSALAPAPRAVACEVPLPEQSPKKALPATDCPADPTGPMVLPRGWVSFAEAPGAPRVAVEIAATEASRERGLMYRTKMPDDQGMIFDFDDSARRSFWMRNTCIPLDMLFIDADGAIAGVLEQVPPLDESPRGVPCAVSHVLELNAGWTRAHGIRPGQHVRIES
jgi:uncharacterized membrane protein (UPF0127 family)